MSGTTAVVEQHPVHIGATFGRALGRVKEMVKRGGAFYAAVYAARWVVVQMADALTRKAAEIERRANVVEPWAVSAERFTSSENRALWNTYDWSTLGEEWTPSEQWRQAIVEHFMAPYVPEHSSILEIGPGGGRWTDVLRQRAERLVVLDVAERPLQLCRERFRHASNIEFLLGDGRSIGVPDQSIDGIWSYDVFVHINPADARSYIREFSRILRPGAHAVVHHPGQAGPSQRDRAWRSDLTDQMVRTFLQESGLRVVATTRDYVNPGDVLTVMQKPR